MTSRWSEERKELVTKFWVTDGLSASQIASRIGGITRNAVIGIISRMGLTGRRLNAKSPRPKRRPAHFPRRPRQRNNFTFGRDAPSSPEKAPELPKVPQAELRRHPSTAAVPFLETRLGQCRYIIDDSTKDCCGAPTEFGSSWCEEHERAVFAIRPNRSKESSNGKES